MILFVTILLLSFQFISCITNSSETNTVSFQTTPNSNVSNTFPPESCVNMTTCTDCIRSNDCVWCTFEGDTGICKNGALFGPEMMDVINTCGDWRWKQCAVNGKFLFVGGLGIIGLVLVCMIFCICYCCCCSRSKKRKSKKDHFSDFPSLQMEEGVSLLGSKHPQTDARRIELQQKYGKEFRSSTSEDI